MQIDHRGHSVMRAPILLHVLALAAFMALSACASSSHGRSATESMPPTWSVAADRHCLAACPRAPRGDQLVEHTLYTLANNANTKFADWVAYVVREDDIASGRERDWQPDPEIDESDTLEEGDYRGAHAQYGYEMGHQAPLQSFGGADAWEETNYLSNITPQIGNLNSGRWGALEGAERRLAQRLHRPVYVLTGPLYERRMPALPNADEPHRVPSGYWKIVALSDRRAVGFIFYNRVEESTPYCDEIVSISEIERRSHLDIFPGVSLRTVGDLSDEIGC